MASRESQGLQVALILFVMVTVVLAVTTYMYFRRAEENVQRYLAKAEEAKREKDATMKLQFENQILKHILGYDRKTEAELTSIKQGLGGNKQIEQILAEYDTNMKMYGAGYTGPDLSYTTLPKHLITAINARNKDIVDAGAVAKAWSEREESEGRSRPRRKRRSSRWRSSRRTLAKERDNFNAERTRITEENGESRGDSASEECADCQDHQRGGSQARRVGPHAESGEHFVGVRKGEADEAGKRLPAPPTNGRTAK